MQGADLVIQIGFLNQHIITGVGICHLCRSQAQLRLAQFDDGTDSRFIAGVGQIISFRRMFCWRVAPPAKAELHLIPLGRFPPNGDRQFNQRHADGLFCL